MHTDERYCAEGSKQFRRPYGFSARTCKILALRSGPTIKHLEGFLQWPGRLKHWTNDENSYYHLNLTISVELAKIIRQLTHFELYILTASIIFSIMIKLLFPLRPSKQSLLCLRRKNQKKQSKSVRLLFAFIPKFCLTVGPEDFEIADE